MHHYRLRYIDAELCAVGFSLLEFYDDTAAIAHANMLLERGTHRGIEVWDRGRLVYHRTVEASPGG